jgi:hypothetical protein
MNLRAFAPAKPLSSHTSRFLRMQAIFRLIEATHCELSKTSW